MPKELTMEELDKRFHARSVKAIQGLIKSQGGKCVVFESEFLTAYFDADISGRRIRRYEIRYFGRENRFKLSDSGIVRNQWSMMNFVHLYDPEGK